MGEFTKPPGSYEFCGFSFRTRKEPRSSVRFWAATGVQQTAVRQQPTYFKQFLYLHTERKERSARRSHHIMRSLGGGGAGRDAILSSRICGSKLLRKKNIRWRMLAAPPPPKIGDWTVCLARISEIKLGVKSRVVIPNLRL